MPLRVLRVAVIIVRTIECRRDALRPALGNWNAIGGLGNAAHSSTSGLVSAAIDKRRWFFKVIFWAKVEEKGS